MQQSSFLLSTLLSFEVDKDIRPIEKFENLVLYSQNLSKKEESQVMRRSNIDTYHDHILPLVNYGEELFNPENPFYDIFISALYLHDLVEDHRNKYIVFNPFNFKENASLYMQKLKSPFLISINNLFAKKSTIGKNISFCIYLFTKYPHLRKSYIENLSTASLTHQEDILKLGVGTALGKMCDIRVNNSPNESCKNDPILLEKRFRVGLEKLAFDIQMLKNFILNPEFEHFELYDYKQVKSFIAKTTLEIMDFYRQNPLNEILENLHAHNVQINTKDHSLDFYEGQLKRFGLMPKRLSISEKYSKIRLERRIPI